VASEPQVNPAATEQPVRALLVSSHPVQYAAPVFRRYAADPRLDVLVAFCSLQGAEPGVDPEFGTEVTWDVPLLEGYRWVHVRNRSPRPRLAGSLGLVNPGLWSLIRRGGFDVVVCYGYRAASFWIATFSAKASGAALLLTTDAHALAPRDGRQWKVAVKRLVLPHIFGLADGVLTPSSKTARFVQSLGIPPQRVFLTPFVVDTPFFERGSADTDRAAVRSRWGIPLDAPVGLFCGKLVRWKRPADVLEAAAAVEGLYAILVGEGPLRRDLEEKAHRLGIDDRVRFLGFVNQRQLPETYGAADFLVLPSEHEPFGVVVNEAFACGRPAIVSKACGSAGDLVTDGETGFAVDVGDVRGLADGMRVLADPETRRVMGEKARARVAEWSPTRNVEAFVEACVRGLERRPR
jgi:glycosyltransferase involved in cell wall biosynthesis